MVHSEIWKAPLLRNSYKTVSSYWNMERVSHGNMERVSHGFRERELQVQRRTTMNITTKENYPTSYFNENYLFTVTNNN